MQHRTYNATNKHTRRVYEDAIKRSTFLTLRVELSAESTAYQQKLLLRKNLASLCAFLCRRYEVTIVFQSDRALSAHRQGKKAVFITMFQTLYGFFKGQ